MNPADALIPSIKLNLTQTLALGAAMFFLGVFLKRKVRLLRRLNIPSAVVGGLLFAGSMLLTRDRLLNVNLDTSAQPLFMVTFFTTIGMQASLPLLKTGGIQVVKFLVISSLFCLVQNFVGMGIAAALGVHPLVGVVAGSVTLVGGPATGLAFARLFEQAGVNGAGTLAIAAATFGIVCGGVIGGPVGTWLIKKHHLRSTHMRETTELDRELHAPPETLVLDVESEDSPLVVNLIVTGVAMGLGSILSGGFQSLGWTLPAYIGAMLVASLLRNIDDATGWLKIDTKAMEVIGGISLNIFLVIALMDLRTWELLSMALPLLAILAVQVLVVVLFVWTVGYRLMGSDYDSAVMAGGFIGFVLGTVANAIANMRTLVSSYGPSPRAFIVVPMVGAFFIDFINALIIVWFINWLR
jgi:glutamate:Na+ symporter, ESS family